MGVKRLGFNSKARIRAEYLAAYPTKQRAAAMLSLEARAQGLAPEQRRVMRAVAADLRREAGTAIVTEQRNPPTRRVAGSNPPGDLHSEQVAWRKVIALGQDISGAVRVSRGKLDREAQRDLGGKADEIIVEGEKMLRQLGAGIHQNPPLVIYGNPRRGAARSSGLISKRVYAIEYKHLKDGKDYRHDFSPGVDLFAHSTGPLSLDRHDLKPLSADFDV